MAAIVRTAIIDTIDRRALAILEVDTGSRWRTFARYVAFAKGSRYLSGISPTGRAVTPVHDYVQEITSRYTVLYSDACVCIRVSRARRLYCYKNLLLGAREFVCE